MNMQSTKAMRLENSRRAIRYGLLLGTMVLYTSAGAEQSSMMSRPVPLPVGTAAAANLERVFWECDYVATTRGVHSTPIEICAAVFEEVKRTKFGGDSDALIAWWRQMKPAAHAQVATKDRMNLVDYKYW
jgi:hypothetical protein